MNFLESKQKRKNFTGFTGLKTGLTGRSGAVADVLNVHRRR
jgi:hypothetical protein